jgi:hypothetical protein
MFQLIIITDKIIYSYKSKDFIKFLFKLVYFVKKNFLMTIILI